MPQIIIFIAGIIVGGIVVYAFCGKTTKSGEASRGIVGKQADEKEKNKEILLGILETQTPLTNNHVEQLLGVSDATATRYLDELEKEGKIRQVGKTGKHVYYEKI
jgi:Fic family protein